MLGAGNQVAPALAGLSFLTSKRDVFISTKRTTVRAIGMGGD